MYLAFIARCWREISGKFKKRWQWMAHHQWKWWTSSPWTNNQLPRKTKTYNSRRVVYQIFLIQIHLRNVQHENSAKVLRNLNIICSTQWLPAQIFEIEFGDLGGTFWNREFATPWINGTAKNWWVGRVLRSECFEEFVHLVCVFWCYGIIVNVWEGTRHAAIVWGDVTGDMG